MRAQLVLLVVCVVGTAMAGYPKNGGLSDLKLATLLAKYLRSEPNTPVVNQPDKTVNNTPDVDSSNEDDDSFNEDDDSSDEDDDECASVQPPCEFDSSDNGTAFYGCAFRELKQTENAIARLVRDNFHEDIFRKEEMDIVWNLRGDWKLSMEMKEVVEVIFMELAEARYSKYDWENVDDASAQSVQTKVCQYMWLREQTFEKGKFYYEQ